MDWDGRHQGLVCGTREDGEAFPWGAVGVDWQRRGGAAHSCKGAGAELPRGLRPIPATGKASGTYTTTD